jgi:hypothetical protein
MHMPDGFIDGTTSLAGAAVALAGLTVCVKKASQTLDETRFPMGQRFWWQDFDDCGYFVIRHLFVGRFLALCTDATGQAEFEQVCACAQLFACQLAKPCHTVGFQAANRVVSVTARGDHGMTR